MPVWLQASGDSSCSLSLSETHPEAWGPAWRLCSGLRLPVLRCDLLVEPAGLLRCGWCRGESTRMYSREQALIEGGWAEPGWGEGWGLCGWSSGRAETVPQALERGFYGGL